MSMLCPRCHRISPDEATFCAHCGASLRACIHTLTTFSVAWLIVLHFLTLGIFSIVWLNLLHGRMPRRRADDPTAGTAVGFLFIPLYNLYWWFFTHLRLCDRLNELRRDCGLPPDVPGGLALATCIIYIVPYVDLLSWLILYPLFAGIVQTKVNELVQQQGSAVSLPSAQAPWSIQGARYRAVCANCGRINPESATYCAFCGARVVDSTTKEEM